MIKQLKEYFGFVKEEKVSVEYPDSFALTDALDLKVGYLKSLDSQEGTRLSVIETKTSQVIGQTAIIFSLLSIFISNYLTNLKNAPFFIQASLIFVFILTLFFYLVTIFQATKYLNIGRYAYGQRSVSTVQKIFKNEDEFKIEEIKDLIYSIERNIKVNNQKSNNLLYAYRSFRIGTILIGLLAIMLIASGYFLPKTGITKVNIENPVVIKNLDSVISTLNNRPETNIIRKEVICDSQMRNK